MQVSSRWVLASLALLACAPGPRRSSESLAELSRSAERCSASIEALVRMTRAPGPIDSGPIESACEPVFTQRARLADGFEAPDEYRLLLGWYLNLSALYEVAENRDPALVERTLLRAARIAEDARVDPERLAYIYVRLAELHREDRPDEHDRLLRKALDLGEQSGDLEARSGLHLALADVRRAQGKLSEAEALARQGLALVEERILRIESGEKIENARVRGPEPEASQRRTEIARSGAERRLESARKVLADIELCQRYAAVFEAETAARCCREGELLRALDPEACRLPVR